MGYAYIYIYIYLFNMKGRAHFLFQSNAANCRPEQTGSQGRCSPKEAEMAGAGFFGPGELAGAQEKVAKEPWNEVAFVWLLAWGFLERQVFSAAVCGKRKS